MTELQYSAAALRGDYVRAGIGLALTLGPQLAIPLASPATYVLAPAALLFLAFGVRTWRRQKSRILLTSEGISLFCPHRVNLDWTNVRSVRLSYFSTRRDRTGGWMQLTLKGTDPQRPGRLRTIRVDSTLEEFTSVAAQAAAAALRNGLALSEATAANFAALGIGLVDAEPYVPAFATEGRER